MLARYTMERGKPARALPPGIRQDTRKHTRHCLRPAKELVETYLASPGACAWRTFETSYRKLLEGRFQDDRMPFDTLAALARDGDVHIGCSCPTARNPDVNHCHTVLALQFMRRKYPDLDVVFP
jgi:hypothetical protein